MPSRTQIDLRRQVGQLLILGFDGTEATAKLRSILGELQPGGVILFARNVKEPRQTWELLRASQRAVTMPMFTCVDMEGGSVDRLRDVIAPVSSAQQVASSGNRELFRKHGNIIGHEVYALGFNTDFAPVLDLATAASRAVLTTRTVSSEAKPTVAYAREFLRGLRAANVLGCGKHFPGLGEATLDTHKKLPTIQKSWKRLWNEDLAPYRVLRRELPFVMVAHAAYPALTRGKIPASLSRKWITGILRQRIGYRGLIVSDDLEMGGVLAAADIGEAAVGTIEAGADIYLVCHREELVRKAYTAVLTRAERDHRFARRVTESCRRILRAKLRLPKQAPCPTEATMDRLRRSIWELEEEVRLAGLESV